jgi:hypothetical protein
MHSSDSCSCCIKGDHNYSTRKWLRPLWYQQDRPSRTEQGGLHEALMWISQRPVHAKQCQIPHLSAGGDSLPK